MTSNRMVSFATPAGSAEGYLVRPTDSRVGLVVLQEWWGLVPHIKDVAGRFAAQGYVALAPDLYHGKSTVEAEEAHHLMQDLDWGRAVHEIGGAVRYLRDEQHCHKVGVVGFCMGGALTMLSAALPEVDAYNSYYGYPPNAGPSLQDITAPGLIFFGEHEDVFPVADAQAFAAAQRHAGRECEVVVYPHVGHAFFNDTRPEVFDQATADDAWRRTLALFARHLQA